MRHEKRLITIIRRALKRRVTITIPHPVDSPQTENNFSSLLEMFQTKVQARKPQESFGVPQQR